MPARELEAFRAPLLSQFVAHARQTSQFYRDRLDFNVDSPNEICKQWLKIPISDPRRSSCEPGKADQRKAARRIWPDCRWPNLWLNRKAVGNIEPVPVLRLQVMR
jgi:hypothetical protein